MPRRCTICTHKSRAEIDKALVVRRPFRAIAGQHGVSKSALVRHHDDHLPAALVKAQDAGRRPWPRSQSSAWASGQSPPAGGPRS